MSATVFLAPNRPADHLYSRTSVFFAGSIEMDKAERWQDRLTERLADLPINIFNPRREKFDVSIEQSKDNPAFREQVEWELDHLFVADVIAMYFDSATKSPISLLELGLHADSGKVIVCCPEGFWRKGNVDIVCERYGLPVYEDFESFAVAVKANLIFE